MNQPLSYDTFDKHQTVRLWRHADQSNPLDEAGFFNPSSSRKTYGLFSPQRLFLVRLEDLAAISCLFLLGEPGLGKSKVVRQAASFLETDRPQERHLWVDLKSVTDTFSLTRKVFDSAEVQAWKTDQSILNLWLDSLDESLLQLSSSFVADEISSLDAKRLRLRVCCRSAVWPEGLAASLVELFGKDAVATLQLCSLSRGNVEELTKWMNVEPSEFLSWLETHRLGPLATRPLTLRFLLNGFKSGLYSTSAPTTRAQVFLDGCLQLVDEPNLSRRERRTWKLPRDRRLQIAAHIAAVSILSGRPGIQLHSDTGNSVMGFVTENELWNTLSGTNYAPSSAAEMREALDTALFSGVQWGEHFVLHFAHRTYTEFLAAHFLLENHVPETQLWSLFLGGKAADLGTVGVVPQLSETAAWMCMDNPKFLHRLIAVDPYLLMTSNVILDDPTMRAELVNAYLQAVEGEMEWDTQAVRAGYSRLDHPDIVEQLQPIIADRTKDVISRRAAIDIAERCLHGHELASYLADIALDPSEDILIRQQAAHAVKNIGDKEACLHLKPLALKPQPADKHDELKGVALTVLWPQHLTAKELFGVLTPPKSDLIGAYHVFTRQIEAGLQPEDLPDALRWCAQQGDRVTPHEGLFDLQALMGTIFDMACTHLEKPLVAPLLAKALKLRLENYDIDSLWKQTTPSPPDEQRRQVAAELVRLLATSDRLQLLYWKRGPFAWVLPYDWPWILKQLQRARSEKLQQAWARLLHQLFQVSALENEPGFSDSVLALLPKCPALSNEMQVYFEPVRLDSPLAQQRRQVRVEESEQNAKIEAIHQQHIRQQEQTAKRKPREINALLEKCDQGDLGAWPLLNLWLLQGDHALFELGTDLSETSWWKDAKPAQRRRLLAAARIYLEEKDPQTTSWIGQCNTLNRVAAGGHRALLLLFLQEKTAFDTLSDDVLGRWATAVMWFPWFGGEPMAKDNQTLLGAIHARVPDAVAAALRELIHIEAEQQDHLSVTRKLNFPWSQELHRTLMEAARDTDLGARHLGELLATTLEYETTQAWVHCYLRQIPPEVAAWDTPSRQLAAELLEEAWHEGQKAPSDSKKRKASLEKARVIAVTLLERAGDGGWPLLWPLLQTDQQWGRQVVSEFAEHDFAPAHGLFLNWMPDAHIADWYLWLWKLTMPKGMVASRKRAKNKRRGLQTVFISSADHLVMFRDQLQTRLQNRGTWAALRALERIKTTLPGHWVKYALPDARRLTRERTWEPPTPQEVAELVRSPEARLVRDGDDLLRVVCESLVRLNAELQDETPAAPDFWNTAPSYQPKSENEMSDVIKRFLSRDIQGRGIVIHREVEIRRGEGKGDDKSVGERTDLHVTATIPARLRARGNFEHDEVTLIIEVKGAWHPKLQSAMQDQLRDRYLSDNACQHGLYLVIWPECRQWDKCDKRQKDIPKLMLDEARRIFEAQADNLSRPGQTILAFVLNIALR